MTAKRKPTDSVEELKKNPKTLDTRPLDTRPPQTESTPREVEAGSQPGTNEAEVLKKVHTTDPTPTERKVEAGSQPGTTATSSSTGESLKSTVDLKQETTNPDQESTSEGIEVFRINGVIECSPDLVQGLTGPQHTYNLRFDSNTRRFVASGPGAVPEVVLEILNLTLEL